MQKGSKVLNFCHLIGPFVKVQEDRVLRPLTGEVIASTQSPFFRFVYNLIHVARLEIVVEEERTSHEEVPACRREGKLSIQKSSFEFITLTVFNCNGLQLDKKRRSDVAAKGREHT